jgi:hypothetical protein
MFIKESSKEQALPPRQHYCTNGKTVSRGDTAQNALKFVAARRFQKHLRHHDAKQRIHDAHAENE